MPVAHFTLHAYGTWMPDRPEGSVHWRHGYQMPDDVLAAMYHRNRREDPARFDDRTQRLLLVTLGACQVPLALTLYAAATDPTHLHVVAGWRDEREPERVRRSLKGSLTRVLNTQVARRTWLTRGGDIRRVRDIPHLDRLCRCYLPDHPGWKWDRHIGYWLDDRGSATKDLPAP